MFRLQRVQHKRTHHKIALANIPTDNHDSNSKQISIANYYQHDDFKVEAAWHMHSEAESSDAQLR